jgi:hypothetical protein
MLTGLPPHLRSPPPDLQPAVVLAPSLPAHAPDPELEPEPKPKPEADPFITTEPNNFGLYRQYTRRPQIDSKYGREPEHLRDNTVCDADAALSDEPSEAMTKWFHLFSNMSSFQLVKWFYGASNTKSIGDLDSLKKGVISTPDFNTSELENFSTSREMAQLDAYDSAESLFAAEDS